MSDTTLPSRGGRILRGTGWTLLGIVTFLEVMTMGDAGLGKFESLEGWMYWFARFGYPPQMSMVIGALELLGSALILVPRLAPYAAIMLGVIMLGALEAVLTTETALGWFDPTLHLVFLTIIGTTHWKRRWRPGASIFALSPTRKAEGHAAS